MKILVCRKNYGTIFPYPPPPPPLLPPWDVVILYRFSVEAIEQEWVSSRPNGNIHASAEVKSHWMITWRIIIIKIGPRRSLMPDGLLGVIKNKKKKKIINKLQYPWWWHWGNCKLHKNGQIIIFYLERWCKPITSLDLVVCRLPTN